MTEPAAPGSGRESIWRYPPPPRVEPVAGRVRVVFNGVAIADTMRARRVLERGHPPTYYVPPEDVRMQHLTPTVHATICEFKGRASYYTVTVGDRSASDAAWCYPAPVAGYESIRGWIAFYPSRMEACYVGDERVRPEESDFYGGWITSDVALH